MTLKEIADLAGVSIMTVSNVINGKHNRVSEKTIEKVNAIIRESGYVPNLNARSLTSKSSNIIQIIISADEADGEENYLENPYISSMVGTIEKELRHSGYYTMVRSVSKKTDVSALLKASSISSSSYPSGLTVRLYVSCFSPASISRISSFSSSPLGFLVITICRSCKTKCRIIASSRIRKIIVNTMTILI